MTQEGLAGWTLGGGQGFGQYGDRDEGLHPEHRIPGDTLTETWAYMWYVPQEQISFFAYVWVHPNLGVLTSGLTGWRGHKPSHMAAELFDIHAYLSTNYLGDGRDVRLPNSLHIEILEPFRTIHLTYDDPARGNMVDVEFTAYSPPIMRESRLHFDQGLRVTGRVQLRGRSYDVDGYGMRDRSWGELRPENHYALPPYTWMTGTFPGADMCWNVCAHDDSRRNPQWLGTYDIKPEDAVRDGWVYRDGRQVRLKEVSVLTTRDPNTLCPMSHSLRFRDLDNRAYEISGKVLASLPWGGWPNSITHICLTEWSWAGHPGYGDTQEVQWNDFVHAFRRT